MKHVNENIAIKNALVVLSLPEKIIFMVIPTKGKLMLILLGAYFNPIDPDIVSTYIFLAFTFSFVVFQPLVV